MKINVGDTVIIEGVVEDIDNNDNTIYMSSENSDFFWASQKAIKQVIPKPFDWKDVKRGMAFTDYKNVLVWLLYKTDITHEEDGDCWVVTKDKEFMNSTVLQFRFTKSHGLTRAPEHDMEVDE